MMSEANSIGELSLALMKVIVDHFEQKGNRVCRQFGLTVVQFRLLGLLDNSKTPISMKELENFFMTSQATVQGIIERTAKKGFIQLLPNQNDKRQKQVMITELGQMVYQKTSPEVNHLYSELTVLLTTKELHTFYQLLKKIESKW